MRHVTWSPGNQTQDVAGSWVELETNLHEVSQSSKRPLQGASPGTISRHKIELPTYPVLTRENILPGINAHLA